MCGTPWQMVAVEMKFTQEVQVDKARAGPPLPRIVVEGIPEVQPRRFNVLSDKPHTRRDVENKSKRLLREP